MLFGEAQENYCPTYKSIRIDSLISVYHNYNLFNGSVLVAEKGNVIFKKGYGEANIEWNLPNEQNTVFRIGSMTKQFTAMLIMQLFEEGKIKLDTKITEYLPEYRSDTGDQITVKHLLTHTSGIPNFTRSPKYLELSHNPYTVSDLVSAFCSEDLRFKPGSKFSYSNSGYLILGAIIEKITDNQYEEVLKEKILDPLLMKNTGYDHTNEIIPNRANGYRKVIDGYLNANYVDMSVPYSAGAMYSTIEDLFLWDQALYTNQLISNNNKDLMFTPLKNNYAFGWSVKNIPYGQNIDSVKVIRHNGSINGFQSLIIRLVDDGHVIILLSNAEATRLGKLSDSIINILYDQPFELPKQSIIELLYKTIVTTNIKSGIDQYYDIKNNSPENYTFSEAGLNRLGYELLEKDNIEESIGIFQLMVAEYPESSNAYDSLGEAYMINRQKDLAIKNYNKSLELDPDNKNAIKMLEQFK